MMVTTADVENGVGRCEEGRSVKGPRVLMSHGVQRSKTESLVGSHLGPAGVWMRTQVIWGKRCRHLG